MDQKIVKTVELENGYQLTFIDLSRKISDDAVLVKMKAVMDIDINETLFTQAMPSGLTLEKIQSVLGETIAYEYEVERNFVMNHEQETVFDGLIDTFWENLGQYVSKPNFPEKVVLKAHGDKTS